MTTTPPGPEFDDDSESDPLLDSLLDEVLGGQRPPDLTREILARWQVQTAAVDEDRTNEVLAPPIAVATRVRAAGSVRRTRRAPRTWAVMVGACVLALLTTWWAFRPTGVPTTITPVANRNPVTVGPRRTTRPQPPQAPRREVVVPAEAGGGPIPPADATSAPPASSQARPTDEPDESTPPPATAPASQWAQLDDASVIEQLNRQLQDRWQQLQIVPAQQATDEVWCRRVYQHVIGREPYAGELRDFLRLPTEDRQVALVNQLLGPQYTQEFSGRWAERWTDWLLQGIAGDSRTFRTGLQTYLTAALSQNRPYDRVCAELIMASGANDPTQSDFNGATNYLLALREKSEARDVTSQVCRAIVGQRLSCAECHDDRLHARTQTEFWQLTATLNSIQIEVLRPGRRARLQDADPQADASVPFVDRANRPSLAAPGGLDGEKLSVAADRSLRAQLAEQLVASDDFARAAVNRFWSAFLQYGFTLPVDDMGRHNPTSDPELVAFLSGQFAAHDYDLRHLVRWITLSDAFNRSELIMAVNAQDAPTEGGQALFSRCYHRPVLFSRTGQGLDQLAAGNSPQVTFSHDDAERQELVALRYGDINSPARGGSVPAADRMGQLLPSHYLSLISALAQEALSPDQQFEHAYRAVLGRRPRADEQAQAAAIFRAADGNTTTALERIFWVLLNSAG